MNQPSITPQTASDRATTPITAGSLEETTPSSSIRRRGRPPGAKNKHPRESSGTPTQLNMLSRRRIDTTPARPSGLRNTVSSTDGIAVVIPSPSPSTTNPKPRRGRPPRKSSAQTSQQTSPIYRVYKCQWKNCPAELHNLETLKKHVLKHGDQYVAEGGPFPCLWKGCGSISEDAEDDEDTKHQPLEFRSHEIWAKHIQRHIIDDAWRLGDGPNNRSDSDMSDYVSDSARRQVTPIITGKGPPDPFPLASSDKPAKVYHKAHGITTEIGKAEAFLAASEERRKNFGPGIDRIGATFVTKRKQALLSDQITPMRKVQKSDGDDV